MKHKSCQEAAVSSASYPPALPKRATSAIQSAGSCTAHFQEARVLLAREQQQMVPSHTSEAKRRLDRARAVREWGGTTAGWPRPHVSVRAKVDQLQGVCRETYWSRGHDASCGSRVDDSTVDWCLDTWPYRDISNPAGQPREHDDRTVRRPRLKRRFTMRCCSGRRWPWPWAHGCRPDANAAISRFSYHVCRPRRARPAAHRSGRPQSVRPPCARRGAGLGKLDCRESCP